MRSMRPVFASFALICLLSLSACGFSPMYGSSGLARGLVDMRVETGQDRVDFLLQEALHDRMGNRNAEGPLILRSETSLNSVSLGVGADAVALRFAIRLRVSYEVYRDGEIEPLFSGVASGEASYDVSRSVYGSLSSERDAEERAVRVAADRMTLQLAQALQDPDGW
jgi:LPS-assembly lipoprotein